jgi:GNAT superfamily N-acetyltransferase
MPTSPHPGLIHNGDIVTGPAHLLGVSVSQLAAFYEEHWPRPMALQVENFYRWQFVMPPENEGQDCCVVAMRGSQVLGIMGLNRRTFLLDGNSVKAAELTTWVVSEQARGHGIGRSIMQSLQATYDLLIGFGISRDAMPIYTTHGFRHLAQIPRYFRIYDIEKVRAASEIDRLGERLQQQWSTQDEVEFNVQKVDAKDLAAAGAHASQYANLYLRDAASLAWRYTDHPVFEYEAYLVHPNDAGQADSPGMAVILRRDEVDGICMLHIVDMFGDPACAGAAIAFVDCHAKAHGSAFADITMGHSAMAGELLSRGWFSTNDDYFFQLPHLFYPFELRTPATTSLVMWSREERAKAFDFGRLYMSKGDLDLDRPTLDYYRAHGITY